MNEDISLLKRLFADIYPQYGLNTREGQIVLAMDMLSGLRECKISLNEAEVGLGKTLAYLTAAIIHKLHTKNSKPILIATSSIGLQNAIQNNYIPQMSDILVTHGVLARPIRAHCRKGKGNYLCEQRYHDFCKTLSKCVRVKDSDRNELLQYQDKRDIDLTVSSLSSYTKHRICVEGECSKSCKYRQRCRYLHYCNLCLAGNFDILITNHNFLLADTIISKTGGERLNPECCAVIIDEAHKLPAAAKSMYVTECDEKELSKLFTQIPLRQKKQNKFEKELAEQIKSLGESWERIFSNIGKASRHDEGGGSKYPIKMTTGIQTRGQMVCGRLHELSSLCQKTGNAAILSNMGTVKRICMDLEKRLSEILSGRVIRWYEKNGNGITLYSLPKDLPCRLYAGLWSRHIPYILTSGTLSANGSFTSIEAALGLNMSPKSRIMETAQKSPYNYRENTLTYFPRGISNTGVAGMERTADEIANLIRVTCGHTLVLFTSYKMMKRVFEIVEKKTSDYPLYMMERRSLGSLERYKQSTNGVLFATDVCGEGIDIPGDTLSSLIVVRLPFAVPDPITEYESKQFESLHDYLDAVTVPNMLIKLRQYAGRLIRTEHDTGVISILDGRAGINGSYHRQVCSALFDSRITYDLYDVWAFFHNRKEDGYFHLDD